MAALRSYHELIGDKKKSRGQITKKSKLVVRTGSCEFNGSHIVLNAMKYSYQVRARVRDDASRSLSIYPAIDPELSKKFEPKGRVLQCLNL